MTHEMTMKESRAAVTKRPKVSWPIEKAMNDIQTGLSITEVAKKYGVPYASIHHAAKTRGITGGKIQRDMRPIEVKIRDRMKFHLNGCISWIGGDVAFTKKLVNRSRCANFLFGTNFNYRVMKPYRDCLTKGCLNQDHYNGKHHIRDKEIRAIWRRHMEAKTTLREIGERYGITRQRVEQIIKEDELSV